MTSALTVESALQWTRFSIAGACFIAPTIVWFVITAAYPNLFAKKYILYTLTVISCTFATLSLTTDLVALYMVKSYWGYLLYPSVLYFPVSVYISGSTLLSILLILNASQKNTGLQKKQMRIFFIAFLIPLVGGIIFEILLPLMSREAPPITSALFSFTNILIAFAILKYEFLSISPTLALEQIFNTMHDALMVIDESGKIVLFNKASTNLTNYINGELTNMLFSDIMHHKDGSQTQIAQILGNSWNDEPMCIVPKNSTKPVPILLNSVPLSSHSNATQGSVLVLHDITAREELIQHLKDRTLELEKSKGELEATLSNVKKLNTVMIERELKMVELKKKNKQLEGKLKNR